MSPTDLIELLLKVEVLTPIKDYAPAEFLAPEHRPKYQLVSNVGDTFYYFDEEQVLRDWIVAGTVAELLCKQERRLELAGFQGTADVSARVRSNRMPGSQTIGVDAGKSLPRCIIEAYAKGVLALANHEEEG